jgi:hypothetical protein
MRSSFEFCKTDNRERCSCVSTPAGAEGRECRMHGRFLVAAAAAGALILGGSAGARSHQAAARPNVVVIETDDQTLAEMAVLPKTRASIGGEGSTASTRVKSGKVLLYEPSIRVPLLMR